MAIKDELRAVRAAFIPLTIYKRFEYVVILALTALISIVVIAAVWTLSLKVLFGLVLSGGVDPADYSVFQAVFGMIFTVIIALEFKKSLLVAAEPGGDLFQISAVVLIALLAICRKFIILDLAETDAPHVIALAAAALALGVVYWLVRARDDGAGENS
ncbi:phosphate-starvation-inducible PsiE family protein [Methylopila sp. 73B]|uniref:phosphate-starvation-inducible PsiE family protein n=1 Tax=Methylopila sp. 73B TaxID=1120792 RepID=UPI00036263C0|nr:phosphate-starvation-inducible PsiE family protein [Methylopila sp. 73B]